MMAFASKLVAVASNKKAKIGLLRPVSNYENMMRI